MGLPQLESCCFFFDLKTGNIVMGCLNALLSFILFVIMIVLASTIEPIKYEAEQERDLNAEAALTGLYVMSIILVLMFFVKFIFDMVFVYGVVAISYRPNAHQSHNIANGRQCGEHDQRHGYEIVLLLALPVTRETPRPAYDRCYA
ncbi:unnamed protein product, partial [Brenthis ino]